MSKRAVLVGCNYVGKPNQLKGCVNDALAIRELLMQRYGFMGPNVRLLIDEPARAPGVPSVMPTRANILAALDEMLRNVRRGDTLVFTYSGHGVQSARDASRDENDGRDECFLFMDGVLTDDDFARLVLSRVPPGVRMLVITDCCHSATLCDLEWGWFCEAGTSGGLKCIQEPRGAKLVGDIISIGAAMDNQVATDGAFEGKWVVLPNGRRQFEWGDSHGALTWALLKVLEAANYAALPAEELIKRLQVYITVTLKKPQVCQLSACRASLSALPFFPNP